MPRRIALAAALAAIPVAATAQASSAPPARTSPVVRPPHHTSRAHHGSNGSFTPAVVINPRDYIPTPNPHKTPFHNTTHVDIPPGQDVFSSQSTGK